MAELNLPNIREGGNIRFRIGLEDGGVAVDWSGLEDIRVFLYADAQKLVSGEMCEVAVDEEDNTVLKCKYSGDDVQYRGINSVLVRAKYLGEIKVYDKPAINIVARTSDATGVVEIDDPVVPVQISVEDVSTSLLNNAIDAAINAAAEAEKAAHLVPLQVLEDCVEATGKALEAASKAPYIDETTGNWFVWDAEAGEYVDSGKTARGATGNGIASWSVVESQEDAGNNVVTVTFTDGTSESFNVKNGHTGNGIASIVQTVESPDDAGTNVITITMTNGTVVTFNVKNGSKGTPGVAQAAYKSVSSLPTASAQTMDKIYLTPSGTSGVYNMSYTEFDGSAYSWQDLGTTAIQLSDYATKAELDQLEAKVDDFNGAIVVSHLNLIENWDTSGARALSDLIPVKGNTLYSYYRGVTPALTLPVAIIQYNAGGTQISSNKVSSVTTDAQTAFIRIDDYKSVIETSMLIEGSIAPTKYVSYEDSKSIATEDEDFNEGIKQIVEGQVLPDYVVNGNRIKADSIPIGANDWLKVISNNIVDNTTNVAGKSINPTTGELQDYQYTNVSQFIGVIGNKKYLVLKGATAIAKYNKTQGYISQENVDSKNYVTFDDAVAYIRVTTRYNEDAVIIASDDIINMSQSSLLKVSKHSSELYQNIADNLANAGSKVLVGTKYNILSLMVQASLNNGIFRLASATGNYISNRIFDKGTFTFATENDYDLEHLEYSVVKYDEDDIFVSKQDFTGVASFEIGDEDCAYFRIFGAHRATCLVIGDSADYGKKDADTYLVRFRNDDYREQILSDILNYSESIKPLLKTLYPGLYGKKYVALGDSNTHGSGPKPYCQIAAEYYDMPFVNYGIHSSTIAEYGGPGGGYEPMCVRYASMDADAEIVTVMGGGNDLYDEIGTMSDRQENGQYTLYSGCHKLFTGIMERYPNAKVGVILPPQNAKGLPTDTEGSGPDIDLQKREAKVMVVKQVAEHYSLPVLDLFHHGGINGYGTVQRELFFQLDKLHLTAAGQARLAVRVIAWMKTL